MQHSEALSVISYRHEIERCMQLDMATSNLFQGFSPGKTVGVVWRSTGHECECIIRITRVKVDITKIDIVCGVTRFLCLAQNDAGAANNGCNQ